MPFKYLMCEGRLSWLVRIFHCGITLGVIGSLLFTNSVLYEMFHSRKDFYYGIIFLLLHLICLILYITVSYMDPGYVSKNLNLEIFQDDNTSSEDSELDSGNVDLSPIMGINAKKNTKLHKNWKIENKHCFVCGIEQPLRCRHCPDCQRCVMRYDHHCPWIDNCIGEYNHPVFFVFLVFELAAIFWTFYWSWISIHSSFYWSSWLNINMLFFVNIIICVLGGIPLFCLLIFHSYLACNNSTTWETAAREKITYLKKFSFNFNPFHQGYCRNMMQFCCRYEYPKKWEVIYQKNCQSLNETDSVDLENGEGHITFEKDHKFKNDI